MEVEEEIREQLYRLKCSLVDKQNDLGLTDAQCAERMGYGGKKPSVQWAMQFQPNREISIYRLARAAHILGLKVLIDVKPEDR